MRYLALGAAGLMLAACQTVSGYVSPSQQACIVNTGIAMQADDAAAGLRPAQKAALIAQACGVSADAILFKLAEAE